MRTTHTRKQIDMTCPVCLGKLSLERCKQPGRTTYHVICETCVYPAIETHWMYTKEDAIQSAKNGEWRGMQ